MELPKGISMNKSVLFVMAVALLFGGVAAGVLAEEPATRRVETFAEWQARQASGSASKPASRPASQLATPPASMAAVQPVTQPTTTSSATRVVYVLDHGGHLLDHFNILQSAVRRAVESLPPDQMFGLIVFTGDGTDILTPGAALTSATVDAKRDAGEKLERVVSRGMTSGAFDPFLDAFKKAFAMKPTVVYFLTDGDFDPKLIDAVRSLNTRTPKIRINTIAFTDNKHIDQMRQIAKDSGGTFKFLARGAAQDPAEAPDPPQTRPGSEVQAIFRTLSDAASLVSKEKAPPDATTAQRFSFDKNKRDRINALQNQARDRLAAQPVDFVVNDVMPQPLSKGFLITGRITFPPEPGQVTADEDVPLSLITQDAAAEGWNRGQRLRLVLPAPLVVTWMAGWQGGGDIHVTAGK